MTLKRMIRKLRLRPGDIILVRQDPKNYDSNLSHRIARAGELIKSITWDVPVVEVHSMSKKTVTIMEFQQLERAYLMAKEAHERRKTETETTTAKDTEGTGGTSIRPFAGGGTPADPLSAQHLG